MKRNLLLIVALSLWTLTMNAQWELVWSDEFNSGTTPSTSKWRYDIWAPGNVNNEKQAYTNRWENCRIENGVLKIEARRDWHNGYEYTSARLNSTIGWTYGRFEARMKLPGGWGTWPAFWLYPDNESIYGWNSETNYWWPNCGEIDIMEEVGYDESQIHASVHSNLYYFKKGNQRTGSTWINGVSTGFHVYACEWYADRIDFFVDGVKFWSVYNDWTGWQAWPFNHNFHIILNLAVGGDWGGAQGIDPNIWPRSLDIDYVRVYKAASNCGNNAVPGKIETEKYCQMSGIQVETCSEGTQNVGWIDNGDWMNYNISVPSAGSYRVSYRVASPNSTGSLRLDKDAGATTLGTMAIPNTGGWQSWATVSNVVNLPAGTYSIGLNALTGGFNINWIDIQPNNTQSFYQKIEAENYTSMSGIQTENCSEGTLNVGWIDANDWMSYNVNLPYTGTYTVKYRVASPNTTGTMVLSKNGSDIHSRTVPSTGGWQNWTTLSQNVNLTSGQQSLALFARTGGYNINWWSIEWGANGTKAANDDDFIIEQNVNNISFYPNPATDVLNVSVGEGQANFQIYDLNGKLLLGQDVEGNETIDISSLKQGVYIIKATNSNGQKVERLIKE
ncbi:MAG: carbohydrate-binding protein [Bacteroidales bacterium]|nr:carbohydrate-binding protein [Bacteroidales bacterium]